MKKKNIETNKTIAVAESCTGGLVSKRLTDAPGSSNYIKMNVVTYSDEAKIRFLKVPKKLLKKFGAVSSEVSKYMAIGVKNLAGTDIGLSITGIAGPSGGTKEKPVGLVFFGLAVNKKVKSKKVQFSSRLSRKKIRWLASEFALNWLREEMT